MKNIVIKNQTEFDKLAEVFKEGGAGKLHVLSDFDRTLTHEFTKGEKIPSLISILRDGSYLSPGYAEKAHALFNKYHPMEKDTNLSIEEKKKAMGQWWRTHFKLLIDSGLNRKDLERVIKSDKVRLREGCAEFLNMLKENNIPLVIFSSAGVGDQAIKMYLQRENVLYNNIHVVSNSFEWGANGEAIAVKEPVIHSFNKDTTSIKNYPVHEVIKDRKNVLVVGDGLNDAGMIEGFEYDNLLKIAFLNDEVEEMLNIYLENFDAVITYDSSFEFVNDTLTKILSN